MISKGVYLLPVFWEIHAPILASSSCVSIVIDVMFKLRQISAASYHEN